MLLVHKFGWSGDHVWDVHSVSDSLLVGLCDTVAMV